MPPPAVPVSVPIVREVQDFEEFPGRTDAVSSVDVRARVTGYYLGTIKLREGDEVKKGEILGEIDPRPYQAELNRAEANLVQAQAHRDRLEADFKRAAVLYSKGSISREDYDKFGGDRAEAIAAVGVAVAQRDAAELNLKFTKMEAPISGLISRRNVDPGNLIKADDTILTNIVSLDPIYVWFDADERTFLRVQQMIESGKIPWSRGEGLPVSMALAGEKGFPHEGRIYFADNRVDADTGTWRLRATFANPAGKGPLRALTPGLFVRMHLPLGPKYEALVISEQALVTNQGQKSVFVVKDDNTVDERRVKVGRLQEDGLRVIEKPRYQLTDPDLKALGETDGVPDAVLSGLKELKDRPLVPEEKFLEDLAEVLTGEHVKQFQKAILKRAFKEGLRNDERVVVNGLQRVRGPVNGVRMSVTPTPVPMPVMQAPAEEKPLRKAPAKQAKKEATAGK
jgi:RND family efflux transporter MFP subunit